jgi:hypothetical protein
MVNLKTLCSATLYAAMPVALHNRAFFLRREVKSGSRVFGCKRGVVAIEGAELAFTGGARVKCSAAICAFTVSKFVVDALVRTVGFTLTIWRKRLAACRTGLQPNPAGTVVATLRAVLRPFIVSGVHLATYNTRSIMGVGSTGDRAIAITGTVLSSAIFRVKRLATVEAGLMRHIGFPLLALLVEDVGKPQSWLFAPMISRH